MTIEQSAQSIAHDTNTPQAIGMHNNEMPQARMERLLRKGFWVIIWKRW